MDRILNLETKILVFGVGLLLILAFGFIASLETVIPTIIVSNVSLDEVDQVADVIISKSRKGSIRAEFPSEFYNKTLEEIESIARNSKDGEQVRKARKALKLLKDGRFKK
ncbi:MAG: hypothetical protein KBF93_05960 [Leptospiraceae bacterium]|nr:hypothetical protein [Leptospiraceae bacterium]